MSMKRGLQIYVIHLVLVLLSASNRPGYGQQWVIGHGTQVHIASPVFVRDYIGQENNVRLQKDASLHLLQNGQLTHYDTLILADSATLLADEGAILRTPGPSGEARIIIQNKSRYINRSSSQPYLEVQRLIEGNKGWRMLSSPVSTTYGDMFGGFVTQGFPGATYPSEQHNLLWFDETDGGTTLEGWRVPTGNTASLLAGRGYYFYIFDGAGISGGGTYDDTLPRLMTAEGPEHSFSPAAFTFPVSYTAPATQTDTSVAWVDMQNAGWNLIGNPSASTLDWDNAAGWDKTNIDSTIYIWDPAAGAFLVWNGVTGDLGNGKIAPFQAFWVRANAINPVLSVNHQAKTTDGTFYKSGQSIPIQEIRMELHANGMQSAAFITFEPEGRTGADPRDAYRLQPLNNTWLELFTLSSPRHGEALVINNLPELTDGYYHIPLYTGGQVNGTTLAGLYSLSWSLPSEWPSEWNISLHDHSSKKAISMHNTQRYDFSHSSKGSTKHAGAEAPLSLPERIARVTDHVRIKSTQTSPPFSIIIQKGNPGDEVAYIDLKPVLLPNYPNPFRGSTTVRFTLPVSDHVLLRLFDMQGRLLQQPVNREFEAGLHEISLDANSLADGIYLLQMSASGFKDVIRLGVLRNQ